MKKINLDIRLKSKSANNPNRYILPTLIFVNLEHPSLNSIGRKGFMVLLSWWDKELMFGVLTGNK